MTEHRELEDERRVTRDEAADILVEVGERLRRDGVVEVDGEEVPVPDELELEVEYEEEPGEAEFEVELEWRPESGAAPTGAESGEAERPDEGAAAEGERGLPPYDDVKEEMDRIVKRMHRAVTARRELPDRGALDRFLELNDAFGRYAEDEPYGDRMEEYSARVGALERAYGEGDVERFHGALEDVLASMDACHAEYQ